MNFSLLSLILILSAPNAVCGNLFRGKGKGKGSNSEGPANWDSKLDPEEVMLAAEHLGLSFDDAKLLMEQQDDFRKAIDLMGDDDGFLQAESPLVPDGDFIIMYKNGKIPPERQEAIENFKAKNRNATLKEVPSKYSLKDAEDHVERLAKRLTRKGYSQFSLGIDGDEIHAVVKKTAGEGREKGKGAISTARTADIFGLSEDDDDLKGLMVFLKEHDGEDIVKLHGAIYGGRLYYSWGEETPEGTSFYECTTGFTVRRIRDGKQGVASAGHCKNADSFYDPTNEDDDDVGNPDHYPMTPMSKHFGEYGDLQWFHTKGNQDKPEFYVSRDKKKPVYDIFKDPIFKNSFVCSYSRMTNTKKCPTVRIPQQAGWYDGILVERLVVMNSNFMVKGDSGSPWWYGNSAYGIHSGYAYVGDKQLDTWSKVKLLPKALGVTVMTQPKE